jgi:hypothetical protein
MSFLSSPSRMRGHLLPPPHREVFSQPPRPPWPPSRPVSPPVPLMSPMGDKPAGEARTGRALRQEDAPGAGRQDPCSLLHIGPYEVVSRRDCLPHSGPKRQQGSPARDDHGSGPWPLRPTAGAYSASPVPWRALRPWDWPDPLPAFWATGRGMTTGRNPAAGGSCLSWRKARTVPVANTARNRPVAAVTSSQAGA